MKMANAKEKEVTICPNCGFQVTSRDYESGDVFGGFVPIRASLPTISCPECTYAGLPIVVAEKDLKKIKFPNLEFEEFEN